MNAWPGTTAMYILHRTCIDVFFQSMNPFSNHPNAQDNLSVLFFMDQSKEL